MWLIVGLGNPGDKYKNNRHNIGFMAVDSIADDKQASFKSKFQGEIAEIRVGGDKVILLKPQTYMNESGRSVGAAAKFYKIPPKNIIVLHDELDIKAGEIRMKCGGGNAGHNGLKSMQAHLGTADFWRIRMGIGRPENKNQVSNYVLSDFAKAESQIVEDMIDFISDSYGKLVENGAESYMKDVNAFSKK